MCPFYALKLKEWVSEVPDQIISAGHPAKAKCVLLQFRKNVLIQADKFNKSKYDLY